MSALAQRVRPAKPAAPAAAKPKLVTPRPRGYHHGRTRSDVIHLYGRSKWAGRVLSLHKNRVATGCAQVAWLEFVYYHTVGSNDPKERRQASKDSGFGPVLLPEDAAKESGLSAQMMRLAAAECVEAGFTPRKADSGHDRYRFRLDLEAMTKAPNGFQARDSAFCLRKPPASEGVSEGVEEAKEEEESTTSQESRANAIAPGVAIPAGRSAELPGMSLVCRNRTSIGVTVASRQLSSGKVQIDLLASCAEGESAPGAAPVCSELAGAGLLPPGLHITAPGWKEFAAVLQQLTAPKPGGGYIACPIYLDQQTASSLVKKLKTPLDFFAECARERVSRLIRNNEPVTSAAAAWIVDNANDKWKVAGPVQRAQQEYEQQQLQQREAQMGDLDTWREELNERPDQAIPPETLRQMLKAAQNIGNRPEVARLKALLESK